jgi:hypothetical protein
VLSEALTELAMLKLFKFVFVSALLLFVGLPVAFVLFVMAMAALGVVIGVSSAIIGLMLGAVKLALMILIPVAVIWWVAKVLMAPERTY